MFSAKLHSPAILVASLLATTSVNAATTLETRVFADSASRPFTPRIMTSSSPSGSVSDVAWSGVSSSPSYANSKALAQVGVLKVESFLKSNPDPLYRRYSYAQASWADRVTVSGGYREIGGMVTLVADGTPGTLNVTVQLDGTMSAYEPPGWDMYPFAVSTIECSYVLQVYTDAILRQTYAATNITPLFSLGGIGYGPGNLVGTPPGILPSFSVPYISGVAFDLKVVLTTEAKLFTNLGGGIFNSGEAHADFFDTLNWGGIQGVVDGEGNPVTGYSVDSDSGVDWTQPVEYAGPLLDITLLPNNQAKISWSAGVIGLVLKYRAGLTAPTWTNEPTQVTTEGDLNYVILDIAAGPRFYALGLPGDP